MRYDLRGKPDYGTVRVTFDAAGERMLAVPSAMVAQHADVEMKTGVPGGVLAAAKRKLLSGESFFRNIFTATGPGQTLWLAPPAEGDVEVVRCDREPVYLGSGAYLASTEGVDLDTKWSGARGFFGGTGVFLLRATGAGDLFFAAYGGIHPVRVGEHGYLVDTGHIIGFTGGLDFRVTKPYGLKGLVFSGEGLVCEFKGTGTVWVSTRNPSALGAFLHPFRPIERR